MNSMLFSRSISGQNCLKTAIELNAFFFYRRKKLWTQHWHSWYGGLVSNCCWFTHPAVVEQHYKWPVVVAKAPPLESDWPPLVHPPHQGKKVIGRWLVSWLVSIRTSVWSETTAPACTCWLRNIVGVFGLGYLACSPDFIKQWLIRVDATFFLTYTNLQ